MIYNIIYRYGVKKDLPQTPIVWDRRSVGLKPPAWPQRRIYINVLSNGQQLIDNTPVSLSIWDNKMSLITRISLGMAWDRAVLTPYPAAVNSCTIRWWSFHRGTSGAGSIPHHHTCPGTSSCGEIASRDANCGDKLRSCPQTPFYCAKCHEIVEMSAVKCGIPMSPHLREMSGGWL